MIYIPEGSTIELLFSLQNISSILSFGLMWYASVTILFNMLKKRNKLIFVLLLMPLVFFMSQFFVLYSPIVVQLLVSSPFIYGGYLILFFDAAKLAGAILFGIVFVISAKHIPKTYQTRNYLLFSTLGLIILFVSNQAVLLTNLPFPPFGLASISALILSTYFIYTGIYLSALSISENSELKRIIKEAAARYSLSLLDNISSAQILGDIEKEVINVLNTHRSHEKEEVVVDNLEMKNYINDILTDLRREQSQK